MLVKCELCKDIKPCIQRRDATWACGPCLQDEWQRSKTKLVNESASRRGIRLAQAKRRATA